jgi:hypothetical protein
MSRSENELIDEMLNEAGKDIARQIDKELLDTIMIDVLKSEGWTATTMNPAFSPPLTQFGGEWYSETAEWIHVNATGNYKLLIGQWFFEKKEDAVMFTLKWS